MTSKLRQLFEYLLAKTEGNPRLRYFYPTVEALDTFFFGKADVTAGPPHVREYTDVKRYMILVVLCLLPCLAAGIFNFGWRTVAVVAVSYIFGVGTEAIFAGFRRETINEGAFVTCMLYPLTLPPNVPLWIVAVGIVFGIVFGKEVFGGTGYNIFNPALVARSFVYISFPTFLVGEVWAQPARGGAGGFGLWQVDAVTAATPATIWKQDSASFFDKVSFSDLLSNDVPGCIGETWRLWIIIAGVILMATKVASHRMMLGTVIGAFATGQIGHIFAPQSWPSGAISVLAAGLLFGAVFMATDPVSGVRRPLSQWIYGLGIGAISVVIWLLSGYPHGVMFAILLMNVFGPIIDYAVTKHQYRTRSAVA